MARLGSRDYETLLEFLEEAQAVEGPAPFTPDLLDRLAEIVWCKYASFSHADHATRTIAEYIGCTAEEGRGPEVEGFEHDWWTCARTVELRRHKSTVGTEPVVLSHVFSRSQRVQSDFNGNFRDWGVADEIHVDLDPDRTWSAELAVADPRDFGRREQLILKLLRPHLAGIYRAAELRRSAAETTPDAVLVLTLREREVMRWVADGLSNAAIASVLVVEQSTVRKHLEHVYDKLGVRSRTAALAKLRS